MSAVVVDASYFVGVTWEGKEPGHWLATDALIAPMLFWTEVANAALKLVRRDNSVDLPSAQAGLAWATERVNPTYAASLPFVLDLADETGLSVYDAAYLANAWALSLPLATFDKQLRKAAEAKGVTVLP